MPRTNRHLLVVPGEYENRFLAMARLEPRCRSEETMQQGLEARIADPLWMLARQWQMGEFLAEDNGSPVRVQVDHRVVPIDKVKLAHANSPVDVQNAPPLETYVERERIKLDYRTRVQIGQQFERFLSKSLADQATADKAVCAYRKPSVLGMRLPDNLAEIDDATQRFVQLMQGRAIDGIRLFNDDRIKDANELPDISTDVSLDQTQLQQSLNDLKSWYASVYDQPSSPTETAWKPPELEYEFALQSEAVDGTSDDETIELVAPDYRNGDLDWYSCDLLRLAEPKPQELTLKYQTRNPPQAAMVSRIMVRPRSKVNTNDALLLIETAHPRRTITIKAPKAGLVTEFHVSANEQIEVGQALLTMMVQNTANIETAHFNPTRIGFAGKPHERWWTMEDYNVDLAKLKPNTTDLSKLLLMEFALIYADDWYQFPLELPRGSLTNITKLEVENVFGETVLIDPAIDPGASESDRWELFTLANHSDPDKTASAYLFIPPTLGDREESAAVEEVRFIRDEGANMVFAIEHTVQNGLGKAIEGYNAQSERYMRQRKTKLEKELFDNEIDFTNGAITEEEYLEKKAQLLAQLEIILGGGVTTPEQSGKFPIYKIASTVPDNWIPYVPVKIDNDTVTGDLNSVRLRQANMLRNVDAPSDEAIEPMTRILFNSDHASQSLTWLNEEAVTRMGTKVLLTRQRIRWTDGKTYVWWGRKVKTGRGEGSSRLRFDYL